MNEAAHPRPGQRWGQFQVLAEVARGNMGVVYRARDERGRDVALKVLLGHRADRESNERFQREARTLARLAHRAIVRVEAWGVHQGLPWMALEFVPGTNLQELLDGGPLPLSRALDLLAQVAAAIDHAHSRGVVHRDLKPANVLVGPDGAPRITDFGLARLSDASRSLTQEGDLVGTPVFMSPEQVKGEIRALGPSTDVWALGVILYLLLARQLPFRGSSIEEVGRRVMHEEPTPPRQLNPDVAEDLERICLCALHKDPRARYQSAGELARDLDAFLHGRPVLAGRVTLAVRARRAGRAARLHQGALLIALAGAALVGGLGLGLRWRVASAQAVVVEGLRRDAAEARAAGERALAEGRAALTEGRPARAQARALEARQSLSRAAALVSRASHPEALPLAGAGADPPREDEVARAVAADQGLGALLAGAEALEVRAEVLLPGEPRAEAEGLLERAFAREQDLADLEALAALAERRANLAPAERARRLLAGQAAPLTPRRLALQARLAELGAQGTCPACGPGPVAWRCAYCGHACREPGLPCARCGLSGDLRGGADAVAAAAREAEARRWLLEGRPEAARRALGQLEGSPGADPGQLVLRAEVARRCGEPEECLALLRPLLQAAGEGQPLEAEARIEAARARVDQGRPLAALALLEPTASGDVPVLVRGRARACQVVARHLAGEEPVEAARALVRDPAAPLLVRLEVGRALLLLDPGTPAPPAPPPGAPLTLVLAWARFQAAACAEGAEDALGRWAVQRLVRPRTAPERSELAAGLLELALASPDPWVCAQVALRALPGGADPELRQLTARDERLARLVEPGPAGEASASLETPAVHWLEPPGLAAGTAALAACLQGGGGVRPPIAAALRGLGLAVREAPLDPWPRVQRARLHLLRAGSAGPAAEMAREQALADAAAAVLLAPQDPLAGSLLDQACWAVGLRRAAPGRAWDLLPGPTLPGPGPGEVEPGRSGEPGEALALARLPGDPRGPWDASWVDPRDVERLAAWRLQRALALAGGGTPPAGPDASAAQLGLLLAERLRRLPEGEERCLVEAQRLLEQPEAIDALLEERAPGEPPLATLARLREAGLDRAAVAVARAVAILRQLAAAGPQGGGAEGLRREARRELIAAARRRPSPVLRALEAALEVWGGEPLPGREALADLLEPGWPGELHGALRALVDGAPPPAGALARAAPLRRLAQALATSSPSPPPRRGGSPAPAPASSPYGPGGG